MVVSKTVGGRLCSGEQFSSQPVWNVLENQLSRGLIGAVTAERSQLTVAVNVNLCNKSFYTIHALPQSSGVYGFALTARSGKTSYESNLCERIF